jgi:hypothetical protein
MKINHLQNFWTHYFISSNNSISIAPKNITRVAPLNKSEDFESKTYFSITISLKIIINIAIE